MGNRKKSRKTVYRIAICIALLLCIFACGCGKNDANTKIILTTGFAGDEVFRIENKSCTVPEIMVYLTTTQNQYEEVYGEQIWQTNLDGVTLEDNVKETVLAKIAQIKSLNLLAESKQVSLDKEELAKVASAAETYYASLNENEIEAMGVSKETIEQLYAEYALAEKVYAHIIKDINPEISDDEARIITVEHILIKTYATDGSGKRVEYTEAARATAYNTACKVLMLATDGEHEFASLIAQYSEDEIATYSFGKGEMDEAFEYAAFNLGENEISGVVESVHGYHIIKCINTFNREQTDQNKLTIMEQRKQEVFGEEYNVFVDSLTRRLNEELWESIGFIHDEKVTTSDFFDVYMQYFP